MDTKNSRKVHNTIYILIRIQGEKLRGEYEGEGAGI